MVGVLLAVTVARAGGGSALAGLGLVSLSVAHPPSGLLLTAGFLPLGSIATGFFKQPVPLTEVLVLGFLGGIALRSGWRRFAPGQVPLAVPLLALVVTVSYAVHLAGYRASLGPERFAREVLLLLSGGYFSPSLSLDRLEIVAAFLEGLGLFAAATCILAAWPGASLPFLRCLAVGAGGAAFLNINRLLTVAVSRGEGWEALVQLAGTLRINVHYPDVNAAGSYFALMLFVALGLTFRSRRLQRLVWAAVSVLIGSAMWLTSSRAAWLGACATAVLAIVVGAQQAHRERRQWIRLVLPVAALFVAAIAALLWMPNRLTGRGTSVALEVRRDMAVASIRMLAGAPVFGIGIGEFFSASQEALDDLPSGRYYQRENAHNAFLQLLTELGVVGFVLFLLVLAATGRRGFDTIRLRGGTVAAYAGALCGVVAFLLSALLGHPLLTPTVAYAFWLTLGGIAASGGPSLTRTTPRGLIGVVVVVLLASVPFRASARLRGENLEHVGYGLSGWRVAEDGTRYRIAETEGTVFAPAGAGVIEIPLSIEGDAAAPALVNVFIDSRLVNRIHVSEVGWTVYRVEARHLDARRFVPVTFSVAGGEPAVLRIGKVVVVGPVR